MLKNLLIKNYVLIKHLEIQPSTKFNIITGETGAGKSIMLGALGLLLGNRAEARVMLDENEKCVIEATFDISAYGLKALFGEQDLDYEDISVIRREISPGGKSRAFINDTPVTLDTLKAITQRLMDIHSQHDTLHLASEPFQLGIVDGYAANELLLSNYKTAYQAFKKAERTYETLKAESATAKTELDYNTFQLDELEKIDLDNFGQEELEQELETLENAESIKESFQKITEYLSRSEYSVEIGLKSAISAIASVSSFSKEYAELRERIENCRTEIKDISYEIDKIDNNLVFDQDRIEVIKEKLDTLYSLQQKHRLQSTAELIALRNELRQKIERALNFDEALLDAENNKNETFKILLSEAQKLSEARKAVLPLMEQEINSLLAGVGMPNARLQIEHHQIAPSHSGTDAITYLFSANKGVKPQELKNVASGGEFSRLMLCIKYILAGKTSLPTIIFDEIDTGISGEIAIKVGNMVKDMSAKHQVFVITHLPQMAAKGDTHYFVYKDDTLTKSVSRIRLLTHDERVFEIAQMIGGAAPSSTAFQSARELMLE
jgi:DNA repair protein RecN (Recombination protein N)